MNEIEKVREAALKLLDYQDRTSAELREKLLKKGFSEKSVEETVLAFEESGLVDDSRYASLYAQSKLSSGKGSRWIKQKLREKGISAETVENALDEMKASEFIEDESVLCLKKALSLCGLSERFEVGEDNEIIPVSEESGIYCRGSFFYGNDENGSAASDGFFSEEKTDYFGRKIKPGETDKNIIRKEREKAKASLTRRLISAGFPSGAVFDAVRKIGEL